MSLSLAVMYLALLSPPAETTSESPAAGDIELVAGDESEALYEAGVAEFDQGQFERALAAFDASLRLEVTAASLYARAQTYNQLGQCDAAVKDYVQAAELLPEDHIARDQIKDAIYGCAARTEAPDTEAEPVPPPKLVTLQSPKPIAFGEDPGRKLRTAGIVTLSVGAAVAVIGAGVGGHALVRRKQFSSDLSNELDAYSAAGCDSDTSDAECMAIEDRIDTFRENGSRASRRAAIWLGAGLGLGGAGIVTGALLMREGRIRTRQWRNGRRVAWRLVPTGRGVLLSGEF